MEPFDFFKNAADGNPLPQPYNNPATDLIYNLLFCDSMELYKANTQPPFVYPFDVLYAETTSVAELQKVIDDSTTDARTKILACNRLRETGNTPARKELFAVIVEVGLENGLDVLASFNDGTARYINQTGSMIIWETPDDISGKLTAELFSNSVEIVNNIGPWDEARRPAPDTGNMRITFLVSDGLYFGEGPIDVLFSDEMAGPALGSATQLMQYLVEHK